MSVPSLSLSCELVLLCAICCCSVVRSFVCFWYCWVDAQLKPYKLPGCFHYSPPLWSTVKYLVKHIPLTSLIFFHAA